MSKENTEIEVRFLEVDVYDLKAKLIAHGTVDLGEEHLREHIIYNSDLSWRDERKFLRLRQNRKGNVLTYKHKIEQHSIDAHEIEVVVDDPDKILLILEAIGLVVFREQEKMRHSFELGGVVCDFDTWPKIPTYLELEGKSEGEIRKVASLLGLDWDKAIFAGAGYVIEKFYDIPVMSLRKFTFDEIG